MRKITIVLACLVSITGCGKPAETPAPPAPETSSAPASGSPATASGGAHETRHGGMLVMTASAGVHLHTEAVVTPAGAVQLYVTDAKGIPIPTSEASGTVTCGGTEAVARPLAATPDALTAQCPALTGLTTVRYQLTVRGTPATGELKIPAGGTAAMEHADHAGSHAHAH